MGTTVDAICAACGAHVDYLLRDGKCRACQTGKLMYNAKTDEIQPIISLLDHFAGLAMQALMRTERVHDFNIPADAYAMAEKMLEVRAKRLEKP